ncbi:MAG: DUF4190 domain-containing protein [Mycetocola sp.]
MSTPENTPNTPSGSTPAGETPAAPAYGQAAPPVYGQPTPTAAVNYGEPVYTAPPTGGAPDGFAPESRVGKTSLLAVFSLVAPFVGASLLGIIMGAVALTQLKKTGETGKGLAIAGIVVGGVFILAGLIFALFIFAVFGAAYDQILNDPSFQQEFGGYGYDFES